MPTNSTIKTTKIIRQTKAFSRQSVHDYSCGRKETGDIGMLVISVITETQLEINFGFLVK